MHLKLTFFMPNGALSKLSLQAPIYRSLSYVLLLTSTKAQVLRVPSHHAEIKEDQQKQMKEAFSYLEEKHHSADIQADFIMQHDSSKTPLMTILVKHMGL